MQPARDGLGYILHVNTAGGGKGYTLHVHTAGGGKGYTSIENWWWCFLLYDIKNYANAGMLDKS